MVRARVKVIEQASPNSDLNSGQMRTPRRVFLTWATLRHALVTFC